MVALHDRCVRWARTFPRYIRKYAPFWALCLIVILGTLLRFAGFAAFPAGLQRDEALEALDALEIIAGSRPLFLAGPDPREPLYAYLVAISVSLFGRTPAAVRLPAALASSAMLLAIYLIARSLFDRRTGLLAAFVSAFTVWPIVFARFGAPPVLLPCLLAFALWMGIEAYKSGRAWRWALAGVLMVAAFYTYSAVRVIAFVLPVWAALLLIFRRGRRLWPGALMFAFVLVVAVGPMLVYNAEAQVFALPRLELSRAAPLTQSARRIFDLFWDLYVDYRPRIAVVSPVNSGQSMSEIVSQAARQALVVLRMFFLPGGGDLNYRHNISGRPVFDPLMALPFVLGLGLTFRRERRLTMVALVAWLAFGLLPTVITDLPPHFSRAAGILPVVFIWPALGLDWLFRKLRERTDQVYALMLSGALMLGSAFLTVRDYRFGRYFAQPLVAAYYHYPETEMSAKINQYLGIGWQGSGLFALRGQPASGRQMWVQSDLWGNRQQRFLVPLEAGPGSPLRVFDQSDIPVLDAQVREVLFVVEPDARTPLVESLGPDYALSIVAPEWASWDFSDVPSRQLLRLDTDQTPYLYVYAEKTD